MLSALALAAPTLSVSGKTLHWTPAGGGPYMLQARIEGERPISTRIAGNSARPPAQRGETVAYRVRTIPGGEWSNTVTIDYPQRRHREPKPEEPPGEEPPAEEPPAKEPPAEKPPSEEEGLPEPPSEEPAKPGGFFTGLNAGYWGAAEPADVRRLGSVVRLDSPVKLTPWESAGLKVIADESGPYSTAGVSGLNHGAYVQRVVDLVRENPHVYAIEVLNEPGGSWFWGPQAESAANHESYAELLIEVHDALVQNFGSARPLELASWDGGRDSSNAWGEAWSRNARALADVDGVTNHPYGGTGGRSSAILGNRRLVEADEAISHKPIYITEVGFPTKGPTGDSLQYTEAEQAWASFQFGLWARSTGYVVGITFYGYRDSQEGGGYGIETHGGARKLAFTAVEELHDGLPCTTCS
jgi:hypothetical protein